jgi:hypothetical protein
MNLQATVVSPKGERMTVRLEQTGPGHYEARFPTKEVGGYLLNLMQVENGQAVAGQVVGANVNFSPEFAAGEPNANLLRRIAETGGGRLLEPGKPDNNPFTHDRVKTRRPLDLWEWLLKLAVILFVLDVGVRRIDLDRDELSKLRVMLGKWVFFWKSSARPVEAEESLASLLARRDQVRSVKTAVGTEARPELFQPQQPVVPTELPGTNAGEMSTSSERPATTPAKPAAEPPTGTTSRLLEAKRRAQKRRGD